MRRSIFLAAITLASVSLIASADDAKEPKKSGREKLEQLREDYQPYAFNFHPHHPMYFAVGTDPEKSKYQVSFRYQFIKEDGSLAKRFPAVKGFNLAYTQTSFWDLKSESKPFEDTSYKPEFSYLSPFILLGPSWAEGFQVQGGFRHESNGRDSDESRSTPERGDYASSEA